MFFTFFVPPVIINSGDEKMKKSVPSFVLGLIFSIIGALAAYLFYAIFILVGAFTGHIASIITILPLLNLFSFGISFIGAIVCLINKKVGGIILIVASVISLICYIVIMISLKLFDFVVYLFAIPSLIILFAGILALKKKKQTEIN